MFHSAELNDELHVLKGEVNRLLGAPDDGVIDAAKRRADVLADQIKVALAGLGETLGEQEDRIEELIAERPVATLASAFALGVAVGFMLKRA